MRNRTRIAALASAALMLLGSAACGSDDDGSPGSTGNDTSGDKPQKVVYVTSFGQFGRDAYAHYALKKGYFKAEGLDVEIQPGQGTANAQLLDSGAAQFSVLDVTGAMIQMAGIKGSGKRPDLVASAVIQDRSMAAIMTVTGNNISRPTDLEGKTIADAPASVVKLMFPAYAKQAGIDERKVKWVDSDPTKLFPLLAAKRVDAIGQFVVGAPAVKAITKKDAVTLPYSDVMSDLYGIALYTSRKYAEENPDVVARFRRALLRGLTDALANPDEAGQILKEYVPATIPPVAAAELRLMQPYATKNGGAFDKARLTRNLALAQSLGLVNGGVLNADTMLTAGADQKSS